MSNLYKTFKKTFCRYPKLSQTIKPTNKKTKKIVNQQYLSQINSDLQETFRKTSCGHPKMIQRNMPASKKLNKLTNNFVNQQYLSQKSQIFKKFKKKLPVDILR